MGSILRKIVAVVIDDGRPAYLAAAVDSLEAHVAPLDVMVLINDSGDPQYAHHLDNTYPQFNERVHHSERRGLGGAVLSAWIAALSHDADYVFHAEGDFVYKTDINLLDLIELLERYPHVAQMVLMRQPTWNNEDELRVGGFVGLAPEDYTEHGDNPVWTEHRRLFTFNPMIVPRRVIKYAVANAENFLEQGVTDALLTAGYSFGIWGPKYGGPLSFHVGETRSAGYRW